MTVEIIRERLARNEIPFSEDLPQQLLIYMNLLADWNTRMDLTAVTDEDETLDKHLIDSLTVLKTELLYQDGQLRGSLIDVGTGAGFPGLPLAMACPQLQVTLLDAQQKRLTFLSAVQEATGIKNVRVIHARAEDGGRQKELREQFDFAVARAVAPLNVLCEYLLPYVRVGGSMICWKGPALQEELDSGRKAAHLLGGRMTEAVAAPVADRDWQHLLQPALKLQHTPAVYPRKAGTPKAKPLS